MLLPTRQQRQRRALLLRSVAIALLGIIVLTPRDLSPVASALEAFSPVAQVHAEEPIVQAY